MIPLALDAAIKEYDREHGKGVNHSVLPELLWAGLSDEKEELRQLRREVEYLRKREDKAMEILDDVYNVRTKRDVSIARRMLVKFLDEYDRDEETD